MKCLICYATTDIDKRITTFYNDVVYGENKEDCYQRFINNPYWNRNSDYPQSVVNIIEL